MPPIRSCFVITHILPVQKSVTIDLRMLSVVLPVLCIELSRFLIMDYEKILSVVFLGGFREVVARTFS